MALQINEIPIIDIHDHIFPEKIALRAGDSISEYYKMPKYGDGTLVSLLKSFEGFNLYKVITSSAATHAKNVSNANIFMSEMAKKDSRIIPFGSFHADMQDFETELNKFNDLGLCGVKFHTDFQGFAADDKRLFPLYEMLSQKKLPVLFHVGDKISDLSHPKRILNIANNFPDLIIVAAHMGGYKTKALSEENLVGKNMYFDISEWYEYMTPHEVTDMLRRHGTEKIIYGSDYPLQSPKRSIELTFDLPISDEEKELIFYKNAEKLFNLK